MCVFFLNFSLIALKVGCSKPLSALGAFLDIRGTPIDVVIVRRPTGTIHTSYFILHTSLIISLYFSDKFRFRISDFRLQSYKRQIDMYEIGSRKVEVKVYIFLEWSLLVKRFVKAIFTLIGPYCQCDSEKKLSWFIIRFRLFQFFLIIW